MVLCNLMGVAVACETGFCFPLENTIDLSFQVMISGATFLNASSYTML